MSSFKHKLKTFVKRFSILYKIYYKFGSLSINTLKFFIKPSNTILFVSYGGKKYDDSPKVIYEKILDDERFKDFELVWAFDNPNKFYLPTKQIKIDTLNYYITALKSKVWITNSGIERGLDFKGKNTIYINTWHGTPLKKMGSDISSDNMSFRTYAKSKVDIMLSQGNYESEIFSRSFDIDISKFRDIGLPRNDELANIITNDKKQSILKNLGIIENKKIILYAPTFREYERDSMSNCVYNSPLDFNIMKKYFGEDSVLLLRMHYEISDSITITKDLEKFVIDVSKYDNLNELLLISDILITDYSSIMFDYSITGKPILTYTYDFDKYTSRRGLYFDIRKELPNADDMNELVEKLIDVKNNHQKYCEITENFRKKYIDKFGDSTNQIVDEIYKLIN